MSIEKIRRRNGADSIKVFIETGTLYGDTAALARRVFPRVWSIELSRELHAAAEMKHDGVGINFRRGDSRDVLCELAITIQEPAVFYLDAHWWIPTNPELAALIAGVEAPFPLWLELDIIRTRAYRDVIVVDDVRSFGTENPIRDWADVSLEVIAAYFPSHVEALILGDQAIVYR